MLVDEAEDGSHQGAFPAAILPCQTIAMAAHDDE
jgi:hypothetical protein